jgi:hypothetical protein
MQSNIKDILIITTPNDQKAFQKLLGDGNEFGIKIAYGIQENPGGIAQSFQIAKKFIGKENVALILGDNLFYGAGLDLELPKKLSDKGARIFTYQVSNPTEYGVLNIDNLDNPVNVEDMDLSECKQIYFAGGEPLMMEEHYLILDELEKRGRFDVRLIYNTNFTQTRLKTRSVFDYWRKFKSVSVGASLDDYGNRAEYIRKGTHWEEVEENRREMQRVCPSVDFYVSPTLSIMNAWSLPDFHKYMVEQGFIKAQDLNVNILQDPAHYIIEIATPEYKERLRTKYLNHIMWLRDKDPLNRATTGFESDSTFMNATDNTGLITKFWEKTVQLDEIRKENLLDVIPELTALK